MENKFFETASFHIVKPCNMKCKFCYATFEDMHVINQLPYEDACRILVKLKNAGMQKITFAGGEPLLYKHIKEVINGVTGDTWDHLACVDRMVELGEIKEITKGETAGQYRVFIGN